MAASSGLLSELAKALGQPSKTYRAAQQGFSIPVSAMEGYQQGAEFADKIRQRKLAQQTLAESLGGRDLESGIMNLTGETGVFQHPNLAAAIALKKATMPSRSGMPGFSEVEWDTATDSNRELGKAVYEGRIRPLDMGTRDRGIATKLANEYARINKLAPMKSYQGEVAGKTAAAFATGKPGMNALSLNTALGHANDALDAFDAVANTDTRMLNRPINALRAQSNDPNIIKLQTTLNALSGELATVFKGTGGTDQEIAHWQSVLSQDLTPVQAKGVITTVDSLLRSRLNALEFQRKSGMSGRGEMPLLSPKGAAISERLASPAFGGAKVPSFNTPEEADASGYKGPAVVGGRRAVIR